MGIEKIVLMKFKSEDKNNINKQRELEEKINNIKKYDDYFEVELDKSKLMNFYSQTFDWELDKQEYLITNLLYGTHKDDISISRWDIELGQIGASEEMINAYIKEKWAGGEDFDDEDIDQIRNGFTINDEYIKRYSTNVDIKNIISKIEEVDINNELESINKDYVLDSNNKEEILKEYNKLIDFYKDAERNGLDMLNILYIF